MADLTYIENYRLHNNTQQTQQSLAASRNFNDYTSLAIKQQSLYNKLFPVAAYEELDPVYKQNGFGQSRFDKRARYLEDIIDPTDLRAREQTFLGRLGNDIVKTAVMTGTTAVNLFGLLTAGVGNGIAQSVKKQKAGEDNQSQNNAFLQGLIDNPITNAMNAIDDYFEKIMPNYRSYEEQDTKWYKRAFTPGMAANFWFDDVMKNVGFSIGSMAAAKGVTNLVGKTLRLAERKSYREAFETLGKTLTQPNISKEVGELVQQLTKEGVLPTAKRAALNKLKQLSKRDELVTSLVGSSLGAVGEAQFEANNALHDFKDKNNKLLDEWMENNENHLLRMYEKANGLDDQGKPITFEQFKNNKKAEAQSEIDTQANRVANSVFGWETGLLTLTNFSAFRRFFSGGFRNFNAAAVKAGIENGGNEIISNIGKRIAKNGTTEAFNKLTKAKKITAIAKPLITEGPVEEMGQNFINKASEFYHGSYLNEQLGYLLNPDYNNEAVNRINAIGKGLTRSYGNIDEWLDGFAGSIMGAFGLPNIHHNKKAEREKDSSKKRFEFSLDSGIYGEWKKIHETDKLVNEAVSAVNSYLQSPDKIKEFQNTIAQIALDDKMTSAGLINDPLEFKDSEHISLMKTISAFKNAGMEDILDKYIDSASNDLTDEQIDTIRQGLNTTDAQSLTNDQVRERIKHEASDMKELIKSYREINDNLLRSYSNNTTSSQIDLLSEMLSLSDYKLQRVLKTIKENKHLFTDLNLYEADGKTINISNAVKALTDILQLNDESFDAVHAKNTQNENILTQEQINRIADHHTQKILNSFPQAWNQSRKEETYHQLVDAYVNLKDSIALNNEFAVLINNPSILHYISKQIFDNTLSDAEKKQVNDLVLKFKDLSSEDKIKSEIDNISNDAIKNQVLKTLEKDGNDTVKKVIKQLRDENWWQFYLDTYNNLSDDEFSSPEEASEIKELIKKLKDVPYSEAIDTLETMANSGNVTDIQQKFISRLLSQIKQEKQKEEKRKSTTTENSNKAKKAFELLMNKDSEFRKKLLEVISKRNKNIKINSQNTIYNLIYNEDNLNIGLNSNLLEHKTTIRIIYNNKNVLDKSIFVEEIIDNSSAIFDENEIQFDSEIVSKLQAQLQKKLNNTTLSKETIQQIINKLNQNLSSKKKYVTPLSNNDIEKIIEDDNVKDLWEQYLNPELIKDEEPTQKTQKRKSGNTVEFFNWIIAEEDMKEIRKRGLDTFENITKPELSKKEEKAWSEKHYPDATYLIKLKEDIDLLKALQENYPGMKGDIRTYRTRMINILKSRYINLKDKITPEIQSYLDLQKSLNRAKESLYNHISVFEISTFDKTNIEDLKTLVQKIENNINLIKQFIPNIESLSGEYKNGMLSDINAVITNAERVLKNINALIDKLSEETGENLNNGGQPKKSTKERIPYNVDAVSEEDWYGVRDKEKKHTHSNSKWEESSRLANRLEQDRIIHTFLTRFGAYLFKDKGRLFTEGLYNYETGGKEDSIYFKDLKKERSDIFNLNDTFKNEDVIGIYCKLNDGTEQCIGIVSNKDSDLIEGIKQSGYQKGTNNFNYTTKIKSVNASSIFLYRKDVEDEMQPIDTLPEVKNGETPIFFFVDYSGEVYMESGHGELLEQIKKDVVNGEKNFKAGQIYIASQLGDAFSMKPNSGRRSYMYFALESTDYQTVISRTEESTTKTLVTELFENIAKLSNETDDDTFNEINRALNECFSLHSEEGDTFAYNFVLIRNPKENEITLKAESKNIDTGEQVHLKNEDGKDIKVELNTEGTNESYQQNMDNLLQFFELLNPIFSFTQKTLDNNDEDLPYIPMDLFLHDALLSTNAIQLTPVNMSCYLDTDNLKIKQNPNKKAEISTAIPTESNKQGNNNTQEDEMRKEVQQIIDDSRQIFIDNFDNCNNWEDVLDYVVYETDNDTKKFRDIETQQQLALYIGKMGQLELEVKKAMKNHFNDAIADIDNKKQFDEIVSKYICTK